MKEEQHQHAVLGNELGRRIGPEGCPDVHHSQWFPKRHPSTCEIPYLLFPRSITERENHAIREIWSSSRYTGKDFAPFDVSEVPNKYRLGQVLACGLKASCATYSQHWQGMYFDWTFNSECREAFERMNVHKAGERFSENAFATVVLVNTGYRGVFMDVLSLRRKPIPPSIYSLENLDMGTFEHNLKAAVGAVLGGSIGVNVIKYSLCDELARGFNREGCEILRRLVMLPGMDPHGKVASIIQLGFKQIEDRESFDPRLQAMAGAKLIERKSERRNADFSLEVPPEVMDNFTRSMNDTLTGLKCRETVKILVLDGTRDKGREVLTLMKDRVKKGMDKACAEVIQAYEQNISDPRFESQDFDTYKKTAEMIVEFGKKVLKPRENGHKVVFLAIDLYEASSRNLPIDVVENAVGEAVQAGLNSIHLDGTTGIPKGHDLKYGAFCMTGPIHSAELLDSDEVLANGVGVGFTDILGPTIRPGDKMQAIISICAKREQDAMIAERQAMDNRKSVNDIFWYRTWNHPDGKKLNLPHWISFAGELNVLPIEHNDTPLKEKAAPEYLPDDHPLTRKILSRL
ncbi:MAG: hypothetical protein WAR22_14800 [Desulfomonilia bacterium]|jgi:hypothetical protein